MTFESEEARRVYFLERLREKLQDPEFRMLPGFPKGSDEDILRMSDPPYYTACPNPFLEDFVRVYGRPYDPEQEYHREPFAVDVSVGKTHPLYKAHGYHTKVPHLAIAPSVLHYTDPGDIVLDGFAGSGMTGVAAQWCGIAPEDYRIEVEHKWNQEGRGRPNWGSRLVILNDLSPIASFIAANYVIPFDIKSFIEAAERLLQTVENELQWMYETRHVDGRVGRINYTVWSEVFSCPNCAGEIVFLDVAYNPTTGRVADEFLCPHCKATVNKATLDLVFETVHDPGTSSSWRRVHYRPVLINYEVDGTTYEKTPDSFDLDVLNRIACLPLPPEMPTHPLPIAQMYHGSRLAPKGITHVHHLFLPRSAQALGLMWRLAKDESDTRLRNILLFLVEQAIWTMSLLNRYRPTGYSQVNQYLSGVYYIPSQHSEISPRYALGGKLKRLAKTFNLGSRKPGYVSTGDCGHLLIPNDSIDYIFTDPPFGENIFYADLNFLLESWHGVCTAAENEAVVDEFKNKGLQQYQELMHRCFSEYYRVLKPGRWITVVFSNSSNSVWRAIQQALGTAGFVIADVGTLDKKQGSYRQVTSSAVKQDLIISAYKPGTKLVARVLQQEHAESVWAFVDEHLQRVPLCIVNGKEAEVVIERTPQMLLDRMISFHVQKGLPVPIDSTDFFHGLEQRYAKRDGMYFLHDQVSEYDKIRSKTETVRQLSFDITDEASAILWLRVELERKPQSFQDLQPVFMRESQAWAGHEKILELREILEENFLMYDGTGPVPPQIHAYLSSNFKDMRGLDKNDPALRAKAANRWYVPDPSKQSDLEKLRTKRLLKEFQEYKKSKQRKIRLFRTEAVRAGFKAAYDARDYRTIVEVARKLPQQVIQEDEKLLMYYDVARMRLGED